MSDSLHPAQPIDRFRSYNQFPLHYPNVVAMQDDLARIADMGFTSVWCNPLFETCQTMDWVKHEISTKIGTGLFPQRNTVLHARPGSPYAVRSFDINPKFSRWATQGLSDTSRRTGDYKDIAAYVAEAKRLGLTPLSDFVVRHVAVDHPLVQQRPHWFKRHPNGNYAFFGRDQDYVITNQSWEDVLTFDYNDPQKADEILSDYLIPMAQLLIEKFGFNGLRIDAAPLVPSSLYDKLIPSLDALCMKAHGKPAFIIAETLGCNVKKFMMLKGYTDVVMNSVYFTPYTRAYWQKDNTPFAHTKGVLQTIAPTVGFMGNHDTRRAANYYSHNAHLRDEELRTSLGAHIDREQVRRAVVSKFWCLGRKGYISLQEISSVAQTLVNHTPEWFNKTGLTSPSGTLWERCATEVLSPGIMAEDARQEIFTRITNDVMDVRPHPTSSDQSGTGFASFKTPEYVIRSLTHSLPPAVKKSELSRLVKNAMAFAAFASDGGWMFQLGDEWMVTHSTNVFTAAPGDLKKRPFADVDLSPFVRAINQTLGHLPAPVAPEWVQRCYLSPDRDPQIVAFQLHQGESFQNRPHMIVVNVTDQKQPLSNQDFHQLRLANGRNTEVSKIIQWPSALYLCGNFQVEASLRNSLISRGISIYEAPVTPQTTPQTTTPLHKSHTKRALILA